MSTVQANRFATVVRRKLIDNKLAGRKPDSIRGLARTMAKGDIAKAETLKRSLFKWLAAGEPHPSAASRALVAEALGIDVDELDEEGDRAMPVAPDPRDMLAVLYEMLGRALGRETTNP
jgi:hypothetical protein